MIDMIKKILIIILSLILFQQCDDILTMIEKKKNEKTSREILDDIVISMKRDYNLIVDKDKYEVKARGIMPGSVFIRHYSFGIRKKGIVKYKSKYFKQYEERYFGFRPGEGALGDDLGYSYSEKLFIMLSFGFRPYVLNNLLYDKTKGNDFEKIEKIFDESGYKMKIEFFSQWSCGTIDDNIGGEGYMNFVKDKKCDEKYYDEEKHRNIRIGIKKYMEKFKEYFSVERNLETINWEEYMKFNEIYPVLEFKIEGISQEELKKLRKKIKPYFNDKILYIKLMDTNKIVE